MREDTGGPPIGSLVGAITLCAMRIAYWVALALGIALLLYVIVFAPLVVVARLSAAWPLDCRPLGGIGIGCFGPADTPGFLFEADLAIRAMVGAFLVWAFFRHRRDRPTGA